MVKVQLLTVSVLSSLALAACGSGGGAGSDHGSLTLRLDAAPYGVHMPIYAGIEQGYFADEGIDLQVKAGNGSANTAKTVAAGADDIGFADSGVEAVSRSKGMPLVEFFGYLVQTPFAIISRADSGIKTARDLVNGKGGFATGSSAEALFPLLAKDADLPLDKIMHNSVQVGDPTTRDSLFVQGKTDWTFTYATRSDSIKNKCQCDLNVIRYSDNGVNAMANGMITSEKFLADNKDQLRRFSRALQKSIQFTMSNPEKAAEDFMKQNPRSGYTVGQLVSEWKLGEYLFVTPNTKGQPYGCMAKEDWSSTVEAQNSIGLMSESTLDPAVFTNELNEGCR